MTGVPSTVFIMPLQSLKNTSQHIKQSKMLQHHYSPYVVGETTFARIVPTWQCCVPLSPLYLWSLLLVRHVIEIKVTLNLKNPLEIVGNPNRPKIFYKKMEAVLPSG